MRQKVKLIDGIGQIVQQVESQWIANVNITYSGIFSRNRRIYLPGFMRASVDSIMRLGPNKNEGIPFLRYHDYESERIGRAISASYVDTSNLYQYISGIKELNDVSDPSQLTDEAVLKTIQDGYRAINRILSNPSLAKDYVGLGHIKCAFQIDDEFVDDISSKKILSVSAGFNSELYCPVCGHKYDEMSLMEQSCSNCKTDVGAKIDGYVNYPFTGIMVYDEVSDVAVPAITPAGITDLICLPAIKEAGTFSLCEGDQCMIFQTEQDLLQYLQGKGMRSSTDDLKSFIGVELTDSFVEENKDKFSVAAPKLEDFLVTGSWEAMQAEATSCEVTLTDELKNKVKDAIEGKADGIKEVFLVGSAFPTLDGNPDLVKLAKAVITKCEDSVTKEAALLQLTKFDKCDCEDEDIVTQIEKVISGMPKKHQDLLKTFIKVSSEAQAKEISTSLKTQLDATKQLLQYQTDLVKNYRDALKFKESAKADDPKPQKDEVPKNKQEDDVQRIRKLSVLFLR